MSSCVRQIAHSTHSQWTFLGGLYQYMPLTADKINWFVHVLSFFSMDLE